MASLVQQFSGRKRGSSVWTHFKFEEKDNKSRCLVVLPNGTSCNALVATKNPTNLKSHLQKHHKEIFDNLIELEIENKKWEQNMPNQSISTDADARARPLRSHLNQYINDLSSTSSSSPIAFWHQKQESKVYSIYHWLPLTTCRLQPRKHSLRDCIFCMRHFDSWRTQQDGEISQYACLAESKLDRKSVV